MSSIDLTRFERRAVTYAADGDPRCSNAINDAIFDDDAAQPGPPVVPRLAPTAHVVVVRPHAATRSVVTRSPPPRPLRTLPRCDALRRAVPHERRPRHDEGCVETTLPEEEVAPSSRIDATDSDRHTKKDSDIALIQRRLPMPDAVASPSSYSSRSPGFKRITKANDAIGYEGRAAYSKHLLDIAAEVNLIRDDGGFDCRLLKHSRIISGLPSSSPPSRAVHTLTSIKCEGFSEAPYHALIKFREWDKTEQFTKRDSRIFARSCERTVMRWQRAANAIDVCAACRAVWKRFKAAQEQLEELLEKSVEERTTWLLYQANKNLTPKLRAEKERIVRYRQFQNAQRQLTESDSANTAVARGIERDDTDREGGAEATITQDKGGDNGRVDEAVTTATTDESTVEFRAQQITSMLQKGTGVAPADLIHAVEELVRASRSIVIKNKLLSSTNQLLTTDNAALRAALSAKESTQAAAVDNEGATDDICLSSAPNVSGDVDEGSDFEVDEPLFETVPDVSPTDIEELQEARKEAARIGAEKRRLEERAVSQRAVWLASLPAMEVDRPHVCDLCLHRFKYERILIYHRRNVHKIELPPDFLKCSKCARSFKRHGKLVWHMKQSHPEAPREKIHKCPHCEKRFVERGNMRVHVKCMHTKERPCICDVCGKAFLNSTVLRYHRMTHTDRKQEEKCLLCEQCGKTFRTVQSLAQHRRTHRPADNVCDVCGKAFRNKQSLECHRFTHKGERPFCCDTCGKRFSWPTDLSKHRRAAHSDELVCEVCGKRLCSTQMLADHRNVHTGERPHVCEHCRAAFAFRHTLWRHRKNGCGDGTKRQRKAAAASRGKKRR